MSPDGAHVTIGDVGAVVSEYRAGVPARPLRPFVAAYSGYRGAGGPPARHIGAPSPYLTFIVTLDDDLVMLAGDQRASFADLVAGVDTAPVTIVHDGRQSGIQVSLHPVGARALFGCPAAELAPHGYRAADVARWVPELQDRVRAAPDWDSRFRAVDTMLSTVLQPATVDVTLGQAWAALRDGGWAVGELADRMGWGPRRLSREFDREFGVSPQTVGRLGRFDRARQELLRALEVPLLADLAARHGFYDQAHLAREFRAFTGAAPSVLAATERRSVQAGDAAPAADSAP